MPNVLSTDGPARIARARPSPPRALLADPDEPTLALVGHRLERAGFVVETYRNGPELLEAARLDRPDVIVAASRLPGLDGLAVYHALREGPSPPPVVLVFWPGNAAAVARALDAGVADVIVRPLSMVEVVARVKRFVA